jgi:tetratricopeptide (TPR) repeat protein
MNTLLLVLLLQSLPLPPRGSLENPGAVLEIPKQLKKDYDKTWARFLSANEDQTVLREADKLLKKQKDFVPALVVEAYVALYLNRTDDAEHQFEKVIGQDPAHRVALFYLAELAFSREDFRKAFEFYSRLLDLDHGRVDLEMKRQKAALLATDNLLRGAASAEADRRLADAERLYSQAIEIAPREPVLYGLLGVLLLSEKKWDEALAAFNRQADLGGPQEDVQRHIAEALTGLGRSDEAKKVLASLQPANPSKDDFEHRAAELEDLGRWGAEIEQFRRIKSAEAITREQLAVMTLRYFPQVADARQIRTIILDIQDSSVWRDIETVVAAGLFDLTPNRAFGPAETMTRGEFAVTMGRLIRVLGLNPKDPPSISTLDVAASNVIFADVQLVLQCGILSLDNAGQFNVSQSVSGRQAVSAEERLLAFAREKSQ